MVRKGKIRNRPTHIKWVGYFFNEHMTYGSEATYPFGAQVSYKCELIPPLEKGRD